jgi:NADPH:quinone reductase-like Zn-dependent oxidoreductase
MKAVVFEALVVPRCLPFAEIPDPPPPGAGSVQVRVQARGKRYVDVLRAGKYQFRP